MSLVGALSGAFALVIAMTATGALAVLLHKINQRWRAVPARIEVRLHRSALAAILVSPCFFWILKERPFFEPLAKVWSGQSFRGYRPLILPDEASVALVGSQAASYSLSLNLMQVCLTIFVLTLVVTTLGLFIRELVRTARIIKATVEIRRVGKVCVVVSDTLSVPFSLWWPKTAFVCLPVCFCADSALLKATILHEIQHHRAGDTRFVYVQWLIRTLFFWNVAVRQWMRTIDDSQEFACDEAMVGQGKVSARGYAANLIAAAQHALKADHHPGCATGLFELRREPVLSRRVDLILHSKVYRSSRWWTWFAASVLGAAAFGTAVGSQGLIHDGRVSMTQAEALFAVAKARSGFPSTLNEQVLAELNRYLGTPEGRSFTQNSLNRMDDHLDIVRPLFRSVQAPVELMAVPFVESGWRNRTHNGNPRHGAGLWMFIEPTAERFGLTVNTNLDERLDVQKSTVAALALLNENYERFESWELSLLAYNSGEERVQHAIETHGTRDPWLLVQAGVENEKGYLARIMAAVIILANRQKL
jgi:beta-lactamase regulating signal transducer with metallopeptidase domain